MQTILDSPVTAPQREELPGVGLSTRKTADGVLHFGGLVAIPLGRPLKTNDLLQTWPTSEKRNNPSAGRQLPRYEPTAFFVTRRGLAFVTLGFMPSSGGKTTR